MRILIRYYIRHISRLIYLDITFLIYGFFHAMYVRKLTRKAYSTRLWELISIDFEYFLQGLQAS